jgi:hypothetical protein
VLRQVAYIIGNEAGERKTTKQRERRDARGRNAFGSPSPGGPSLLVGRVESDFFSNGFGESLKHPLVAQQNRLNAGDAFGVLASQG